MDLVHITNNKYKDERNLSERESEKGRKMG